MKVSSFALGFTLGGLVTLLDFFEKLKPYGIDVPGFVNNHPYISIAIAFFIITIFFSKSLISKKKEKMLQEVELAEKEEKQKQLLEEKEKREAEMYEKLANAINEKIPDNIAITPHSVSRLFGDVFFTNKLAIHASKKVMIELDRRGLAKLEIDNYVLRKINPKAN